MDLQTQYLPFFIADCNYFVVVVQQSFGCNICITRWIICSAEYNCLFGFHGSSTKAFHQSSENNSNLSNFGAKFSYLSISPLMLCIHHHSTDPYFNIATDEYIFRHIKEDCFMLWQNDNAIIVGKHQNTLAEINFDYVKANNIHVVRRLSGGGAVYHDLGNLNFSFTKTGADSSLMDFEMYTRPILEVLNSLGVPAKFEGRNDLTIDGKKISGNAEHIFKNKILHHGTLLFSSEMK